MALQLPFDEHAKQLGDSEQSGKILLLMAKMGMAREALATMLEFATDGKLHKDHKAFLLAPIIQHKSQWRETTPKWMYSLIGYDRLKIILDERKTGKVGWHIGAVEIATVLYPATIDAPMRHEAGQIYLWGAAQAVALRDKKPVADIWKIQGIHPVTDDDVLNPKGRYHFEYKNFCLEIRRKVVRAGLERVRSIKNTATPQKKKPKPKPPQSQGGLQLDLF